MRVRSLRYFAGPVSMLRYKVQWPQWGQPPSQLDSNKSCNVYSLACTGLSVLVCTGLSVLSILRYESKVYLSKAKEIIKKYLVEGKKS